MQNIHPRSLQANYRVPSIDFLRGLVMIIMALDHVRDFFHWSAQYYSPTDLTHTSIIIFFTRWITHFCAPVFVFLAGTSAALAGARKGEKTLSAFLFKRGVWLILLEICIINFGLFFNIHFTFMLLQTIWALGFAMIALSGLIYLPKRISLIVALLLIFAHNLLDPVHIPGQNPEALGWSLLHEFKFFVSGPFTLLVAYPVLPWIGVMTAGYCLGDLYISHDPSNRKKLLLIFGFSAIILFILLRCINAYGDPSHWSHQQTSALIFLSFLNTTKYPPSLLYLLMTLGPALIFLSVTETPLNGLTKIIAVYGRVPLFYYIVHIYVIHLGAMLAAQFTGYGWRVMILEGFPGHISSLRGYGFPLWIVYGLWIVLVIALYPLCKWYDNYKTRNRQKWWLSYL